ncbi:MAG: dihydroorotate dehydrogenase (quinone), partial [Alphaproteobacteria bacterium]
PLAGQQGGLSGKPLMEKSTTILRQVFQWTAGKTPLIGVGVIAIDEDANRKIRAGASAVQLYTALVYQGFGLVERMAQDGVSALAALVGKDT